MSQIINWLCLICVSLLVFEIMLYFCRDAIRILCKSEVPRAKKIRSVRVNSNNHAYEHKIAK